ncbi:MAG TPA: hypothetical protein VGE63_02060 [Candidatus Paceibacterota bacterium]
MKPNPIVEFLLIVGLLLVNYLFYTGIDFTYVTEIERFAKWQGIILGAALVIATVCEIPDGFMVTGFCIFIASIIKIEMVCTGPYWLYPNDPVVSLFFPYIVVGFLGTLVGLAISMFVTAWVCVLVFNIVYIVLHILEKIFFPRSERFKLDDLFDMNESWANKLGFS